MKMKVQTIKAILALIILSMMVTIAIATPYGPDNIKRGIDERGNITGTDPKTIQAQGGNVTQLTINTTSLTANWQGYYGNISGIITLDDGDGNTLYDWYDETISLVGEIYAANQSGITWSDVICVNLTGNGTTGYSGINQTVLEDMYDISHSAKDGFDETFDSEINITIGSTGLGACPGTHLYVDNSSQTERWNETLLTENATGAVIFAVAVEENDPGFNGKQWDFQMIVAEDGSSAGSTPYSFYIELV
ncbi:MAG: hypothetical protein KAK00_01345 [Nanoarchaeota archaeon]|nr:hypothetical protein [Nanoarchaeota archaeon]